MTRKDYVAIAKSINAARDDGGKEGLVDRAPDDKVDEVARNIADVMAHDNPRFDRARFLAACGVAS